MPTRITTFALLSLVGACAAGIDEPWTPPGSDGKADGISVLDGADIPSSYVGASKHYLARRRLDWLTEIGAVTGDKLAAAHDADGLSPGKKDGWLEAAELVAMEAPAVFSTLSAADQAQLPALWAMLEVPGVEAHVGAFHVESDDRTAVAHAVVAVSPPGAHVNTFALGEVTLTYTTNLTIEDRRTWSSQDWQTWFGIQITKHATLGAPAGGKISIYELGSGFERVVDGGSTDWPSNGGGEILIDRYVGDQLQERHRIAADAFVNWNDAIDLYGLVDSEVVQTDGSPLVRNVVTATKDGYGTDGVYRNGSYAVFQYEPVAHAPAAADPAAIAAVATPISSLAPGRYSVPLPGGHAPCTLDLYPSGVVILDGTRLKHDGWYFGSANPAKRLFFNDQTKHEQWFFTPTTNMLELEKIDGDYGSIVAGLAVTPSMRVP